MGKTLAYKILEDHLLEGELRPGEEITIKMDQTLTQDSTGTMEEWVKPLLVHMKVNLFLLLIIKKIKLMI